MVAVRRIDQLEEFSLAVDNSGIKHLAFADASFSGECKGRDG